MQILVVASSSTSSSTLLRPLAASIPSFSSPSRISWNDSTARSSLSCSSNNNHHHHHHHLGKSKKNPKLIPTRRRCIHHAEVNGFSSSTSAAAQIDGFLDDSAASSDVPLQSSIYGTDDWDSARRLKNSGVICVGKVLAQNQGGFIVRFHSLLGFLPFSEICPSHFCKEPESSMRKIGHDLVGSVIEMKIITADENAKQLIFSESRASFAKHSRMINVRDTFDGMVCRVMDYGALIFLRFPDGKYYIKGLLHSKEVSWDFAQRSIRDVLDVGDTVRVKVIEIDRERTRVALSIKQLEDDPLFETLGKVIHQDASASPGHSETARYNINPLPGLPEILRELLQEQGISGVKINRQGFERRVVSPDLQIWLSNAPSFNNQVTLLARAGRQVQEIQLTTSLDHNGVKRALQRALERVP